VEILRRLGFGRRRTSDFYASADEQRHVPAGEIDLVAAALVGTGPVGELLLRQLREAPHVWRLRSDDGAYELRVSTTMPPIVAVPRDGWHSDPIRVASKDGRSLELRIDVFEAGIVGLRGSTDDGRSWPRELEVAGESLAEIEARAPWLRLPSEAEIRAERERVADVVGRWLGDGSRLQTLPEADRLWAGAPATEAEIDALADREDFAVPAGLALLLRNADGIEIGDFVVLGTADAYRLDIPGPPRLVIRQPDEEGVVVIDLEGRVVEIDIDDRVGTGQVIAPDLRTYVASRLSH